MTGTAALCMHHKIKKTKQNPFYLPFHQHPCVCYSSPQRNSYFLPRNKTMLELIFTMGKQKLFSTGVSVAVLQGKNIYNPKLVLPPAYYEAMCCNIKHSKVVWLNLL